MVKKSISPPNSVSHTGDATDNQGAALPWSRMVVIGDSFAEGLGDPEPKTPGGLRGWADRVAEVFASLNSDFAYANLAVRGKIAKQILEEQVQNALELKPDIIFISAGGNDVLRPRSNPDKIAATMEQIVSQFADSDTTVVLFSAFDVRDATVFKKVREKAAVYSQNIYSIAKKYDAIVVHCWGMSETQDERYWDIDRLHLNSLGHHTVALHILETLNVPHNLTAQTPAPLPERGWRQARRDDAVWAKEFLVPWVIRRIKRVSSGDNLKPKRPEVVPVALCARDASEQQESAAC